MRIINHETGLFLFISNKVMSNFLYVQVVKRKEFVFAIDLENSLRLF